MILRLIETRISGDISGNIDQLWFYQGMQPDTFIATADSTLTSADTTLITADAA